MPDESCRRCGGNLESYALCSQCKDPIENICTVCGTKTEERFHARCFYGIELFQVQSVLAN